MQENSSYLFLPFCFDGKPASFTDRVREQGAVWEDAQDDLRYLYRYITDKLKGNADQPPICFHYQLREEARSRFGLEKTDTLWTVRYCGEAAHSADIPLEISEVHLYCFNTQVGILAFRVSFHTKELRLISNALFMLKKAYLPCLFRTEEENRGYSLLDFGTALLNDIGPVRFFYYSNDGQERANVLSCVEMPAQEDVVQALYYLRHCYDERFDYIPDGEEDETLRAAGNIVWGVTQEASVCAYTLTDKNRCFIENRFLPNFRSQYLFMQVYLLHQRYVLYLFLTKISRGAYTDLDVLEAYREKLYEFETDFIYSSISEVPQYQKLYDRTVQIYGLPNIFADVHEPIRSLEEVRRKELKKEKEEQDNKLNHALAWLAVLVLFSALIDSFDWVDSFFSPYLSGNLISALQIVLTVLIFIIVGRQVVKMIRSGSRDR